MRLNWESITHLFQIPLSWFRDVDRRSHIIGDGRYIDVDRRNQDGTTLALDIDAVKEECGSADVAANKIVKTDGNGQLAELADVLTSNQTKDKVLTVEKGGSTVTWEDAGPKDPSTAKTSLTTTANGGEGNAAAQTNTWTFGGTNGVAVTVQTRTYYDHTASTPVLYGYYRTFTFDRNGKVYSISAETRYTIDQPVVGNLTT